MELCRRGATLFLIQERMISLWMMITTRKGFLDKINFGPTQNLRANTLTYTMCKLAKIH